MLGILFSFPLQSPAYFQRHFLFVSREGLHQTLRPVTGSDTSRHRCHLGSFFGKTPWTHALPTNITGKFAPEIRKCMDMSSSNFQPLIFRGENVNVSFREKRLLFDVFGDQVSDTSIGDFCTDAIRGEEGRTFHRQKKSRRGFSQVSQQRSPMVSRSTKHDRVTIPEGEISLANSGTTTANPPKSQTLSKEKCPFQAEKGVGVILSSQKKHQSATVFLKLSELMKIHG